MSKDFPEAPGNLHAVLESLIHIEARVEVAANLERTEKSNLAKFSPDKSIKPPVVANIHANPIFKEGM
jgi:hypothetical protein